MSEYSTSTVKKTIGSVVKSPKLRASIEKYVLWQSKASHRGSHLFNLKVTRAYHERADLPQLFSGKYASTYLRHYFNPRVSRNNNDGSWHMGRSPSLVPSDVLDYRERDPQDGGLGWPSLEGIPGYARMVSFAANGYATALMNHVTVNTWGFIKKTIRAFYMSRGLSANYPTDHPLVVGLLDKIKDPSLNFHHPTVDAHSIDEFVRYHRDYLDTNGIDLRNPECTSMVGKMIKYFVHLLNYQDIIENQNADVLVPRFHAVPIHGANRRTIKIDAELFFFILKDAGMAPVNARRAFMNDRGLQRRWYRSVFETQKHQTTRKRFEGINSIVGSIVTDNLRHLLGHLLLTSTQPLLRSERRQL